MYMMDYITQQLLKYIVTRAMYHLLADSKVAHKTAHKDVLPNNYSFEVVNLTKTLYLKLKHHWANTFHTDLLNCTN